MTVFKMEQTGCLEKYINLKFNTFPYTFPQINNIVCRIEETVLYD